MSCESCVGAEENGIGWYVKDTVEPLLIMVRQGGTEECLTKEKYNRSKTGKRVRMGAIRRGMANTVGRQVTSDDIDKEKRWLWLKNSDLKAETESLICAA